MARPTTRMPADGKVSMVRGDTCRDGMDLMPVAALGAMEIALRTDGAELCRFVLAGVGVFPIAALLGAFSISAFGL